MVDDFFEELDKELDKEEIISRIEKLEEKVFENMKRCEICGEWYPEDFIHDTTEMINGGCGECCENCIENGEMRWL